MLSIADAVIACLTLAYAALSSVPGQAERKTEEKSEAANAEGFHVAESFIVSYGHLAVQLLVQFQGKSPKELQQELHQQRQRAP